MRGRDKGLKNPIEIIRLLSVLEFSTNSSWLGIHIFGNFPYLLKSLVVGLSWVVMIGQLDLVALF